MPKVENALPTVKEMRQYIGIDGRHNDALLSDFLNTAREVVEKVLRYEIAKLHPMPIVIKEAVKYAVAYLYTHRETADPVALEKSLAVILSAYRLEVF
jgi:hypothetical protein